MSIVPNLLDFATPFENIM